MLVRQRPVRQRVSSPTTTEFANVSVRQRPVSQRVSSPTTSSPTCQFANDHSPTCQFANDHSQTCQFANDQFANVSVRQRPFANVSVRQRPVRQRVTSPTCQFANDQFANDQFANVSLRQRAFANVSFRQRLVRQRVTSPTTSSPTTIRQHVSSPITSSPTCQFAKIINYKNIILVIITFKLTFIAQEKYGKIAKKVFRFNIIFQWEETVQVCDLAGVLLRLYCPQNSVSSIAKLPEFAPFRTTRFRSGFRLCSCAFSTVSRQGNQRKVRQNALRNSLFGK